MTKAMWRRKPFVGAQPPLLRSAAFFGPPLRSQHQNVMKVTPERGANWTFVTLQ